MSDIIITPASGKIDFYQDLGASSLAKIELTTSNDLALSSISGNLIIGDASRDIYIGNGINDVDIIFEQNGEIRPLPSKTLNIGTSGSFTQILASKVNINQNSFTSIPLDVYSSTSGATILNVAGTKGALFSVTDNLSGSLMSVNNDAGLPVFEVFSDDRVVAGRFGQNDFIMTSGGNVGIGTGVPSSKFHVVGTSTFNGDVSSTGSFIGGSGTAALPSFEFISDADTGLFSPVTNNFAISTSGVERLRIDNIGRVGIGTASPNGQLHVSGLIIANSGSFLRGSYGIHIEPTDDTYSGFHLIRFQGNNAQGSIYASEDGEHIGFSGVDWRFAGTKVTISTQTENTIASFDADKNIVSLSTSTYPSLTELGYIKGTTSDIQTQLNAKQAYDTSVFNLGTISGSNAINCGQDRQIQTLTLNGVATTFTKGTGWPSSNSVARETTLNIFSSGNTSITWTIVNDWYRQPDSPLPSGRHIVLLRSVGSGTMQGHYIGNKTN
jgi:hypothetical protein